MLLTRVKLWLLAVGAFLVALGAAYFKGRSNAGAAAEREKLDDYIRTRRKIDEAPRIDGADDARAFLADRLHKRNE